MRPLPLSCLLIVALTGTAFAQTATPESIAWTAYLAAEADDQSRIPQLEAALPLLLGGETSEHRYALGFVAHALVRLKARPRLDLLPALFKRYPLETLLLLLRFGPERNALALRLLNTSRGVAWFGLADLLFQARAPGVAAGVIRDLPVALFVSVSERGDTVDPISYGPATCGCGSVGLPSGFPPLASYLAAFSPSSAVKLLVDGPVPVYYSIRQLPDRLGIPVEDCTMMIVEPRTEHRMEFVKAMLDGAAAPVLRGIENRSVAWAGSAALDEAEQQFRAEIEANYAQVVNALVQSRWLTAREGLHLRPKIDVNLRDFRDDKSWPLR
jgi:hypothetical protein